MPIKVRVVGRWAPWFGDRGEIVGPGFHVVGVFNNPDRVSYTALQRLIDDGAMEITAWDIADPPDVVTILEPSAPPDNPIDPRDTFVDIEHVDGQRVQCVSNAYLDKMVAHGFYTLRRIK